MDISYYFLKYGKEIFIYLRNLVGEEELAKDLLQETFIKAMRYSLREETAKTYLYRIAHSLAMDYLRKNSRFVDVDYDGFYESPEKLAEYEDIWRILSPIERSILTLYYKMGYSYKEISEKLNIPVNTVKSHIYRGKKKIYNYFKEEDK
ncbi:MAG: RNA polymerase [Dictyoglomus sp. NZ13-RE01]|nr:MAG: RNA polymerase [Dictyoglomus sp. NZ13-RE01]